jgi:DNA-binding XRE family transcriptional regulator
MPELVHIDGKPFMLIPLHEYRHLVSPQNVASSDIPDDVLDQLAIGKDHPVKIIRKYRGLTQSTLAQSAGLSRPYLTEIETGRKSGSIAALQTLARALRVSPEILLRDI